MVWGRGGGPRRRPVFVCIAVFFCIAWRPGEIWETEALQLELRFLRLPREVESGLGEGGRTTTMASFFVALQLFCIAVVVCIAVCLHCCVFAWLRLHGKLKPFSLSLGVLDFRGRWRVVWGRGGKPPRPGIPNIDEITSR